MARGMGTRDIHGQPMDFYGVEISAERARKIADNVLPLVKG